jgi:hypothetical protein
MEVGPVGLAAWMVRRVLHHLLPFHPELTVKNLILALLLVVSLTCVASARDRDRGRHDYNRPRAYGRQPYQRYYYDYRPRYSYPYSRPYYSDPPRNNLYYDGYRWHYYYSW